MTGAADHAVVGGRLATRLVDVTDDPAALDSRGFWVVVATFEGDVVAARFDDVRPAPASYDGPPWRGPAREAWTSSLDRSAYEAGVETVRARIAAGDVYQVNLCRMLSAPLPVPPPFAALHAALAAGNPAPYAALVDLPSAGLHVVSASPELFLGRSGGVVRSRPIKGTGRTAGEITDKDVAENVMIVDLVRHDLGRVAEVGSVDVPELCVLEQHPGLVHLVSTVTARLADGNGWPQLLAATMPPGSVSGAPKSSALRLIGELEPVPRGVYCGAVGWIDADAGLGALAIGIRTFTWRDGMLSLGTGAGITWGSDPAREWAETELKTARLLEVATL